MTDLDDLEQRLTVLLAERAASASPPADAWIRIVAELSDGSTGWAESALDSAEWETGERRGDDLTIEYLVPREESTSRPEQKRSIGAVLAVAAAILVVVGAVVAADRYDSDVVTVAPATTPDDVSSPTPADAALPQSVVDPVLGYRWSRVAREDGSRVAREDFFNAVTAGGPGLVAVGGVSSDDDDGAAAVWTSVDGITWSRVPRDEEVFGGGTMESVTAAGRGLVAVGGSGPYENGAAAVWTSVDGITWSRAPHDEAIFGGGTMESVTAAGPGLVAIGSVSSGDDRNAAVWTSVDGITWSRAPHDEAIFGGGVALASVTAGGPGVVAVGGSGPHQNGAAAVWASVDGMSWSRVLHDEAIFGGAGEQWMTSVVAGGPGLVAVGWELSAVDADAAVWTSADGVTWSRVPHDEEVFGGPSYQAMWALTAGGPGVVAVGSSRSSLAVDSGATVWSSPDGITWSRMPDPDAVLGLGDMESVTTGGPGLVAIGDTVWVAALEE